MNKASMNYLYMIFNSDTVLTSEAKQVNESSFKFLERSAWNRCRLAREIITAWAEAMSPDADFISQIKSKNDKQHNAAIFELIVFTFLKKIGLEVVKHPSLKKGATPDFMSIVEKVAVYFECTLSGNSFESSEENRRKGAVEDIIRQIHYCPYFINLDFKQLSVTSISSNKLKKFIDRVKELSDGFENEQLFHRRFLYQENEWKIEISLLRKSKDGIKTSLGYISQDAKVIDNKKAIITALNDKRPSKYGIGENPYVICLCNNDMFFHTEEMYSVLFGTDSGPYIDLSYPGRGGFFHHNKPVNTSVSAIFLFKGTDILTVGSSEWSIWHNPFAKCPLNLYQFPVSEYYFYLENNKLHKKEALKNSNIFDLLEIDEVTYNTNPIDNNDS
ncbi:MAG: hypothetical protein JKY70_06615 [Mucilaginibacter sp.]|nr:hypothetical protein [Mucilaginibacter sp.]